MEAEVGSEIAVRALDVLGRAIAGVYDVSLGQVGVALTQATKGQGWPSLVALSKEQLGAVVAAAPALVGIVLFEVLARLDWEEATGGPVRVVVSVDDQVVENPGGCSDKLPGELLGDGGWLQRFAVKPVAALE